VDARDLRQEVRRAARGDADAAGLLFDHYYPRVYRYALSKLGRAQDAEDVAAETFARVLRRLDRFRWRGAGFEAWIFRIAYNLIVDQYRGSGREELSEHDDTRAEETTPEDLYFQTETASELSTMLRTLSADQREVLLLRFAAGLETEEISRVMGRSPNAIRQLQFRGLDALRKKVHKEDVGV
jgi:RNA polymerase sigma-70 factor, ECF subfamily